MSRSAETPADARSAQDGFWVKIPGTATAASRGYPRVHANVPVRITGAGSLQLDVASNDVSVGGLQIGCDRATAAKLRPPAKEAVESIPLRIILLLKFGGVTRRVDARARVVHMSVVPGASARAEVVVGFRFLEFAGEGREHLERFTEHHMRPAES